MLFWMWVATMFDVARVRGDFPALSRVIAQHPLAYLDNASTTQKPRAVLEAMTRFYEGSCANVHRGVHTLSVEATDLYEGAREKVARFIGARSAEEIVFTRGTTEAINLVASTTTLNAGDEVLITELEHHSNLVPWQRLCAARGAKLVVLPIDDRGELMLDRLEGLLSSRTKVVAVSEISNSLGTVNDVASIIRAARRAGGAGAVCLVDGAQSVAHRPIDVAALDCDFYAFSAHKMYGPMGIGVLYGKRALLEAMPPYQSGGDMVLTVRFEETTYNAVPYKFEAGTPNVAGAVGLAAAIDYLDGAGRAGIAAHESALLARAVSALGALPYVRLIGTPSARAGAVSFEVHGVHPHDVATVLDTHGIAVRSGHHCTQPVMEHFGVPATVRASFGMYNTMEEIDRLLAALDDVRRIFA